MIERQDVASSDAYVVVDDVVGMFRAGLVVTSDRARQIDSRGGCTLPCVPELFQYANGGFALRHWGDGIQLTEYPAHVSPLVLYATPMFKELHWAVYVRSRDGTPLQGALQLLSSTHHETSGLARVRDSARITIQSCVVNGEAIAIVRGRAKIDVAQVGFCPVSFYGHSTNASLVWAAVTQTP